MAQMLESWQAALAVHFCLVAVAVAVGLIFWAGWARRGMLTNRRLSLGQRMALAALLVGLLFGARFTDKGISLYFYTRDQGPGFVQRLALRPGSVFPDLTAAGATSFPAPDFKVVENRRVLMVHPPTWMEWPLDDSVRAVALMFGFDPVAYGQGKPKGADLYLDLVGKSSTREVYRRRLKPVQVPLDRGLQHAIVILPPFESGARLVLHTVGSENNDTSWDWVYLLQFRLKTGPAYAHLQFPNFNRIPLHVLGENYNVFNDETGRPYVFAAAPSAFLFGLDGNERGLEIDYGFLPSAYSQGGHSNGAVFRVEIVPHGGTSKILFDHYPRPVEQPADRLLMHAKVPIPPHQSGDELWLRILAGDHDDASWDHTFIRRVAFY